MIVSKKLMVAGPVAIESNILNIGATPLQYNRTEQFSEILHKIYTKLQQVFKTKNPVLIAAGSGTGMMEFAVINTISKHDTVIVVNGGTFGERWSRICETHGIIVIEVKIGLGESVDPNVIKKELDTRKSIKAVLITHNETSTGALTNIEEIGRIVSKYPEVILIADCITSLIVEDVEMDEWGIDVIVSASHKVFALPPGLGFISFSSKALKHAKESNLRSFYFDVFKYLLDWQRNQTPFTPPINLILQLDERLNILLSEGLIRVRNRYRENTNYLRLGLEQLNLKIVAKIPANCVTAVLVPEDNALEIVKVLDEEYNIIIAPSIGELQKKVFRVGNFGDINKNDIKEFLFALNIILKGSLK